jgi:hypothetical protein
LHVAFDLCDRQPSIEVALQLLLAHYDRDASPPLSATRVTLDKLFELARSGGYGEDLAALLAREKAGQAEFRALLANNGVTHLDRFIAPASRAAPETVKQ